MQRKKVGQALTAVAAALMLAVPSAFSAAEAKGPRLEVTQERHDFGKVPQGQQAEHVFELRNGGDEPLAIERVQTS